MPGRCGDGDVGGRRVLVRRRERGRQPQQRGARPPHGDYISRQPPRGARRAGTCSPCPLEAAGHFAASVAPAAGGVLMRGSGGGGEPGLAAALERYQRRLRGERGAVGARSGCPGHKGPSPPPRPPPLPERCCPAGAVEAGDRWRR